MDKHTEIYIEFEKWLDKLLSQSISNTVIAFNFNLYEEEDETYGIQLIGSDEFSENDDDWACSEIFSSEEDIFYIDHSDEKDADLERGLEFISELILKYFENPNNKNEILKSSVAVGLGFIDGDIKIIYKK